MGLLRGMARTAAVVGTANAVSHRQQQRWAGQAAEQQAAAPVAPAGPDKVTQLQELAKLKEQGILTQEEFDAQKAKILNS